MVRAHAPAYGPLFLAILLPSKDAANECAE
jgi:hypothetical protein